MYVATGKGISHKPDNYKYNFLQVYKYISKPDYSTKNHKRLFGPHIYLTQKGCKKGRENKHIFSPSTGAQRPTAIVHYQMTDFLGEYPIVSYRLLGF
jgi:hypothetical protein